MITTNNFDKLVQESKENAQWMFSKLHEIYGEPEWRTPLPAIDELVSTILSQNTNDRNRDIAFDRLREKYPSWEQVREAPVDGIIEAIRPAGLGNQKGRRIKDVLIQITTERSSLDLSFLKNMPRDEVRAYLLKFKGVGYKTAAIVMQFSLGIPAFPVDTHIYRVSGRFGIRPIELKVDPAHLYLERLFLPEQYESGHLNIIRLGREICQARKPQCAICPLRARCLYVKELN